MKEYDFLDLAKNDEERRLFSEIFDKGWRAGIAFTLFLDLLVLIIVILVINL